MATWNPNDLSEADIIHRLSALTPTPPHDPYPGNLFNRPRRRAAVLIPFTRLGDGWNLLFIRRTVHDHDHHAGQVAFPGGGEDPQDRTSEDTALREAHEEVGLQAHDVRLLGRLEDVITITNYHVTPVVGVFKSPYRFHPDETEVARVFTIPLAWLADPAHHEVRHRQAEGADLRPVIYFKEYDGELVWGFTAALTLRLLEVLAPVAP